MKNVLHVGRIRERTETLTNQRRALCNSSSSDLIIRSQIFLAGSVVHHKKRFSNDQSNRVSTCTTKTSINGPTRLKRWSLSPDSNITCLVRMIRIISCMRKSISKSKQGFQYSYAVESNTPRMGPNQQSQLIA